MGAIRDNLQAVRARIARAAEGAGRDPRGIALVAVSKTHAAAMIGEAHAAGHRAFGENYVQEAIGKMDALPGAAIEWHLVGPLQSNKTRLAAERFDWVQSVDAERTARRLSDQRPDRLPPLNVLLQVNASGESTKAGVPPAQAAQLASLVATLPRLKLRGLMAIPEPGAGAARYRELKRLFDRLGERLELDTLSVGMSDDLELAIAEGSTMVRVGTAIFGERRRMRPAA